MLSVHDAARAMGRSRAPCEALRAVWIRGDEEVARACPDNELLELTALGAGLTSGSTQPRHLCRWCSRQRHPSRDCSRALPGFGVVADAWEPPAQLDGCGQLTPPLKHFTDRSSIGFSDDKRGGNDGHGRNAGQANLLLPDWIP
jgi:hypothetical protein